MSLSHIPHEVYERALAQHELARTLEGFATSSFFVGLPLFLVGSVVLLRGPRRVLASSSLLCFAVFVSDYMNWSPRGLEAWVSLAIIGLIIMTLVSIFRWPVREPWVNWPLITGIGGWMLLMTAASFVRPEIDVTGFY